MGAVGRRRTGQGRVEGGFTAAAVDEGSARAGDGHLLALQEVLDLEDELEVGAAVAAMAAVAPGRLQLPEAGFPEPQSVRRDLREPGGLRSRRF